MRGEPLCVDGGRSDDQPQVPASGQQTLDVAQQEIDVQRPLVSFVDDQRVVLVQEPILLRLGQQDAVGHQFDVRLGTRRVGESHFEADGGAQRHAQLVGQPRSDRPGCDSPRLRVPDQAVHSAAQLQADFRQLGGLARPRLAAHDRDGMFADGLLDLLALGGNRQGRVEGDRGQPRQSLRPPLDGLLQFLPPTFQVAFVGFAGPPSLVDRTQPLAQAETLAAKGQVDAGFEFGKIGHSCLLACRTIEF